MTFVTNNGYWDLILQSLETLHKKEIALCQSTKSCAVLRCGSTRQ